MYGGEPSASADRDPEAKAPRAGGGGRWAVWPSGSGTGNDTTGTAASGFPVALGEAFAMRFAQVYLNYSPSTAAQRAQQLAAFIPDECPG